jgi:hypothetical protein
MARRVTEHVSHRFQFMHESLRCQFRSPFNCPTLALEGSDVSQRDAFEKRGEILDADFTLDNRAGSQRVFDAFKPTFRHGLEAQFGIIRQCQAPDLSLEFFEPAVGQFPILGFQRTTKLLAAFFDEGIIPARRFEPIQVLCDFVKTGCSAGCGVFCAVIFMKKHSTNRRVTSVGCNLSFLIKTSCASDS